MFGSHFYLQRFRQNATARSISSIYILSYFPPFYIFMALQYPAFQNSQYSSSHSALNSMFGYVSSKNFINACQSYQSALSGLDIFIFSPPICGRAGLAYSPCFLIASWPSPPPARLLLIACLPPMLKLLILVPPGSGNDGFGRYWPCKEFPEPKGKFFPVSRDRANKTNKSVLPWSDKVVGPHGLVVANTVVAFSVNCPPDFFCLFTAHKFPLSVRLWPP